MQDLTVAIGTCGCRASDLSQGDDENHYGCNRCGREWVADAEGRGGLIALPPLPAACPNCGRNAPGTTNEPETDRNDEADRQPNKDCCEQCETQLRFYVNEYLEDQAWGGPEEGGWWYDTGQYLECHGCFASRAEADIRVGELAPHLAEARKGKLPPDSVACTGYPEVEIEKRLGAHFPTQRPRYE